MVVHASNTRAGGSLCERKGSNKLSKQCVLRFYDAHRTHAMLMLRPHLGSEHLRINLAPAQVLQCMCKLGVARLKRKLAGFLELRLMPGSSIVKGLINVPLELLHGAKDMARKREHVRSCVSVFAFLLAFLLCRLLTCLDCTCLSRHVFTCICVFVCACACMCVHACTCMHVFLCMCVHMYLCVSILLECMSICVCACASGCVRVCVCACVHTCMCVYVRVCINVRE